MMYRRWFAIVFLAALTDSLSAQVVAPPPPPDYNVELRYRIRAPRNQRIAQYSDMVKALEAAGLKRDASDDDDASTDSNAERIHGQLPPSAVAAVLAEPHVRSLLLTPAGFTLPEGDGRVSVRITIPAGLARDRQQLLHSQIGERLTQLGFVPRVGYDHRGFTQLFGTLPAENLPSLVADLRYQPGGWLAADTDASQLPEPLQSFDPIRITEVIAEPKAVTELADGTEPQVPASLEKLSPDLRAFLQDEGAGAKLTRLEVILFDPMRPEITSWRTWLRNAGTITIEGQMGQVVTVLAPAGLARQLAALPQVASVRLPARASESMPVGDIFRPGNAIVESRLDQLHSLRARGHGVTIALIDSDFAGVKRFLGRSLPANTLLLDLTAERNPSLEPDPILNSQPGRGTLAALAAMQAAPEARLILVRVDAAAAYQVYNVARYVSGESFRTEAMQIRNAELLLDNERLRQARDALSAERQAMNDNFDSDDGTPEKRAVVKRRLELQKLIADQQKQETDYSNRLARFIALERGLAELKSASVVACNLVWNTGYAVDGTGPLSAFLDGPARLNDRGSHLGPLTWLQAAGDTNGQSWAAPAWDGDSNGVLEFAERTTPMPIGKWTRELNFIGWQPNDGGWTTDLPAGAKLRVTLQWTEAHDAVVPVAAQRYRVPLNQLRPVLVRQRDAHGKTTSTDDLVVVARSVTLPQLIGRADAFATFEHTIEYTVPEPGRYAVRIEGKLAASTAPPEIALPPAARRKGEVFPRLFVDAGQRETGRPVFIDFRTVAGGAGTPCDSKSNVVVGAADHAGRSQPYSAHGSAPSIALNLRPTVIAFDEMRLANLSARGTSVSNGFAAGMIAAMISGGSPPTSNVNWLGLKSGELMQVPPFWLEQRSRSLASRFGVAYPNSHGPEAGQHNR